MKRLFLIQLLAVIICTIAFNSFAQNVSKAPLGAVVDISAPNMNAEPGDIILVPITIDTGGFQLWDFQFDVTYNAAVLSPSGPNQGCVTAGAMAGDAGIAVICFTAPTGRLNLATASSSFVTGQGILMYLRFQVNSGALNGATSQLDVSDELFFNLSGQIPTGSVTDGLVTVRIPTAANSSVSGRVLTPDGAAIRNARVVFTDAQGETRSAVSNPFGYFVVEGLPAGRTYVVSTWSKGYSFDPVTLSIVEDIAEFEIRAME